MEKYKKLEKLLRNGSLIFPKSEIQSIIRKIKEKKDPYGIFYGRVQKKIIELREWTELLPFLEKQLSKKYRKENKKQK